MTDDFRRYKLHRSIIGRAMGAGELMFLGPESGMLTTTTFKKEKEMEAMVESEGVSTSHKRYLKDKIDSARKSVSTNGALVELCDALEGIVDAL